jgi:MOSC domain-containing protein YiiM
MQKHPVTGPVTARTLGLDGDQVSNRRHHGGVDKAVYAFAREDLDHWGRELGADLRDGFFGENLTTVGIDVNEAELGERWRIGSAELEVAGIRTPCQTFSSWLRVSGFDNRGWAKRFTAVGRPGPYLRVVTEGEIAAGDEIRVVHRPGHGVTVSATFRELMG